MNFPSPFYRWRPHPWHGLGVGPNPPSVVHAYIEITPFDLVKYEVDKETGYLRVDRPQRTSSQPPVLYGFIPQTYCGDEIKKLSPKSERGDGDPLDICVISERPISKSEIILQARVVGGIQAIDGGEADDKIIAVLKNDSFWGNVNDIEDLPTLMIERIRHYFATYKLVFGKDNPMTIEGIYGCEHAEKVVQASITDYDNMYGR